MDSQIPYFHVGEGVRMPDNEFSTTTKKLFSKIAKARFILKRKFDQKSQRASNIIDLIESVDGQDKIVLMVHILARSNSTEGKILELLKAASRG